MRDARLQRQLLHMPAVWRRADKGLAHLLERIRHEGEMRQPYFRELCAASLLDMLIALVRQRRDAPAGSGRKAERRGAPHPAAVEAGRFDPHATGSISSIRPICPTAR